MKKNLLMAGMPALLSDLFLMKIVGVSHFILGQQLLFALSAFFLCFICLRKPPQLLPKQNYTVLIVSALFLLSLPLLTSQLDAPHRWLNIAGFRLYIAAAIMPALLLLLAKAEKQSAGKNNWVYLAYVVAAMMLALQPDASQVTAFSLAGATTLFINKTALMIKASTMLGLFFCTAFAWQQPDLLKPVAHVEGVMQLAMDIGPWFSLLSIMSLSAPIFVLIYYGVTTSRFEYFCAATYYLSIFTLAALTQLTPMPLLGFGTGPIIGYFLMAYIILREHNYDESAVRSMKAKTANV